MSSIVVGTDGSPGGQAAVAQAVRLARALDAEVHVVSAYATGTGTAAFAPEAAVHADGRPKAEAALEAAAQRLAAAGVQHDTRAVCGSPADALLDVAAIEAAEIIVVGSRGMRGSGRLLGSVPNTVSHKAPCSVMIVRTD